MTGQDAGVDSEAAAHAICASLTCTNIRVKDLRLSGFDGQVDASWIGVCGDCYRDIQMSFVRGDARATVSMMFGIAPPEDAP